MSKIERNKPSVCWAVILFFLAWLGHEFFSSRGVKVINKGVSFGFEVSIFLVGAFLLGWLLFLVLRGYKSDFFWFFWGLFTGGGINFLDRLRYGGVSDYFNFFGLFYNNLADWIIFMAVFGFVVYYKKAKTRCLLEARDEAIKTV